MKSFSFACREQTLVLLAKLFDVPAALLAALGLACTYFPHANAEQEGFSDGLGGRTLRVECAAGENEGEIAVGAGFGVEGHLATLQRLSGSDQGWQGRV